MQAGAEVEGSRASWRECNVEHSKWMLLYESAMVYGSPRPVEGGIACPLYPILPAGTFQGAVAVRGQFRNRCPGRLQHYFMAIQNLHSSDVQAFVRVECFN